MKTLLLIFFLFTALMCKAQSDVGVNQNIYKLTFKPWHGTIKDTAQSYYYGLYSNHGFVIGKNFGFSAIIEIFNMGDRGHVDLSNPNRTAAHFGRPNIDPWVHKYGSKIIYDNICVATISEISGCGEWPLLSNSKNVYGLAQEPNFAVAKRSDGSYFYPRKVDSLEKYFGTIDTLLAYSPAIDDTTQAVLPANFFDDYSEEIPLNAILDNSGQVEIGKTYHVHFAFHAPPSINQGANLYPDSFDFNFMAVYNRFLVDSFNINGVDVKIVDLPVDPVPPAPTSITVSGKSITWAKVEVACLYKVERAMSTNPSGKSFYQPVSIGITPDNSITDTQTLIKNRYYKYYVSAKTSGGWGEKIVSDAVKVR